MKPNLIMVTVVVALTHPGLAAEKTFDVRDFGAHGDGRTLDTASIQKALDACGQSGAGTVILPPGDYLSGSLKLSSKTTLRIEKGATLLARTNQEDYASGKVSGKWGFLVAVDAADLTLTGDGVINGQATSDLRSGAAEKPAFRVRTLLFNNCRNVAVSNLTIRNSDAWTLNFKRCEDLMIHNVTIHNNYRRINSDGIDPDMCRNVRITDCHVSTGDDCIVLKTTEKHPCENVFVSGCVLESFGSALKLGTESFGDFRNIIFTNCVVTHSPNGLGFYCKDGATMENVAFSHIRIDTGALANRIVTPIFMDIERRDADSSLGHIRNVTFEDIDITSGSGVLIQGMPESRVENLTLRNIRFQADHADDYTNRKKSTGTGRRTKDERDTLYARKPAYVTIADAREVTLQDIKVVIAPAAFQKYERSAFYGANIDGLRLEGLQRIPPAEAGHLPVTDLHDCRLTPDSGGK
jgi:polygalacturonase